ncbi:hypothetical protein [Nostoc sp.]
MRINLSIYTYILSNPASKIILSTAIAPSIDSLPSAFRAINWYPRNLP